ncbi:MAG: LUD domain-containing protein [Halodesulfurarchaeum sp.]
MAATSALDCFVEAAKDHDERVTVTDHSAFAETIDSIIKRPAVGASLPFEGVSLEGTTVELDWAPADLAQAETGLTPASFGIADHGTVFVESRPAGDELLALFPNHHVAVVEASAIHASQADAFGELGRRFEDSQVSGVFASGPSATADMGETVQGVHGPGAVHVVVLEDR